MGLVYSNDMENAMFRELIDGYRAKAREQLEDADLLESGRWRIFTNGDDESGVIAAFKRSLAGRLLGLADAYEARDD